MRFLPPTIACALTLTAGVVLGGEPSSTAGTAGKAGSEDTDGKPAAHLTQGEIQQTIAPDVGAIGDCYKRFGLRQKTASGELRVELVIHRRGFVKRVDVEAPGVRGKRLERCVRPLAESWTFPERRYFTVASVPFFFLRTDAKGAGPIHSCWNPRGCPLHRRGKHRNR